MWPTIIMATSWVSCKNLRMLILGDEDKQG